MDTTHLAALHTRLINERARLASSKTSQERELRSVLVAQCERELAGEYTFLGMPPSTPTTNIDDDQLLADLLS